ncbi:MAG: NAD(P)-binding domain-containing protein, partial [Chitinophagaceae bacterium]|nr:NAD(P)-binding domain-containing protein [Chitinophagaceae bacterium]
MGKRIAIIGGGNLGTAIAEGLLKSKFSKASDIIVTKRNTATLKSLEKKGITISSDNADAVKKSEVIILAIKPFQVTEVLNDIKKELTNSKLLISVVTGVLISEMNEVIKKSLPVFRAMPNTAIAIQESMTCICSENAAADDVRYVNELFSKL